MRSRLPHLEVTRPHLDPATLQKIGERVTINRWRVAHLSQAARAISVILEDSREIPALTVQARQRLEDARSDVWSLALDLASELDILPKD